MSVFVVAFMVVVGSLAVAGVCAALIGGLRGGQRDRASRGDLRFEEDSTGRYPGPGRSAAGAAGRDGWNGDSGHGHAGHGRDGHGGHSHGGHGPGQHGHGGADAGGGFVGGHGMGHGGGHHG